MTRKVTTISEHINCYSRKTYEWPLATITFQTKWHLSLQPLMSIWTVIQAKHMNGRIYLSLMAKHMNGRIYLALMVLLTFDKGENDRVLPVCLNTDGGGEEFLSSRARINLCQSTVDGPNETSCPKRLTSTTQFDLWSHVIPRHSQG